MKPIRTTWRGLAVSFPALLVPAAAAGQERMPETPVAMKEILPDRPEGTQVRIVIGFAGGGSDAHRPALFLLDGVEMTREDLPHLPLDPADIESIEVLKGPAAVHLHGERAREGVVIIRTRKAVEEERGAAP